MAVSPLAGRFSVEESAGLMRRYRYATERMMRILGGWIALTPELSTKLLMGRHVWDNAQHADAFGKRLPELRAHAQQSEAPNTAFVGFMDLVEEPAERHQTIERLVGVYRVLKPHLLATYTEHVSRANPVYEPPTRRILERCIEDERGHVAAGETLLRHLASTEDRRERAASWRARLEEALSAAGGVTGTGWAPVGSREFLPDRSPEAEEFIRLDTLEPSWTVPTDLSNAIQALAIALERGDGATIGAWLAAGVSLPPTLESAWATARWHRHYLTAYARIGAYRVVTLHFEGLDASHTLVTRWVPQGDGWRVAAIEPPERDLVKSA